MASIQSESTVTEATVLLWVVGGLSASAVVGVPAGPWLAWHVAAHASVMAISSMV